MEDLVSARPPRDGRAVVRRPRALERVSRQAMNQTAKAIRLGTMMMTLVDPFRGHERRYNRWYEEDHFYAAVTLGPGVLSGGRFVARRQEKACRQVEAPFERDAGSLLAVYWIQDDGKAWREWSPDNVA